MTARKTFLLLAFVAAFPAFGGSVPLPDTPAPVFADLESATNAPIRAAMLAEARIFEGNIALFATPSNKLEVAFGTSRLGDGVLLPGDESLSIGWREGAWFFASATNRIETQAVANAARRSLSFRLRLFESGEPRGLTLAATDAGDAFTPLVNAPPCWLFSRGWNTVRLTINGADNPSETISVQFNTDPGVLIAR